MPGPRSPQFAHLQSVLESDEWSRTLDAEEIGDYIRSLAPAPAGGWSESPEWEQWGEFVLQIVPLEKIHTFLSPADHDRAAKYAALGTAYPPVVLRPDFWVIDGNGRTEAAKLRGDNYILAYLPA